MLLYVHRDCKDYQGRGAQDGALNCHTAPELCFIEFSVALRSQRHTDYVHLNFHTGPKLVSARTAVWNCGAEVQQTDHTFEAIMTSDFGLKSGPDH